MWPWWLWLLAVTEERKITWPVWASLGKNETSYLCPVHFSTSFVITCQHLCKIWTSKTILFFDHSLFFRLIFTFELLNELCKSTMKIFSQTSSKNTKKHEIEWQKNKWKMKKNSKTRIKSMKRTMLEFVVVITYIFLVLGYLHIF